MGDRLDTIDMGRKLGLCPFLGELGPHLTQCGLYQGPSPYQVASWSIEPFCHNRHGLKSGGLLCPLFGEAELGPHAIQWPGPRLASTQFYPDPSNRLATIHQRHRQTDKTDRQTDNGRWTVSQTVAHKCMFPSTQNTVGDRSFGVAGSHKYKALPSNLQHNITCKQFHGHWKYF